MNWDELASPYTKLKPEKARDEALNRDLAETDNSLLASAWRIAKMLETKDFRERQRMAFKMAKKIDAECRGIL